LVVSTGSLPVCAIAAPTNTRNNNKIFFIIEKVENLKPYMHRNAAEQQG